MNLEQFTALKVEDKIKALRKLYKEDDLFTKLFN